MSLAKRGIIVGILAWYAGWVSLPAQTADRNKLTTHFLALVGFPSQDLPAAAVPLVIPGKVVRLGAESGADESILEKTIFEAKVVERLWATFRLDTGRKLQRSLSVALEVNRQFDIPSLESAGVRMSATLLGFNEKIATYRIRFTSGEKALADSSVNVAIGKRAVVGGTDGEQAPYIFLVIEPVEKGSGDAKSAGVTSPETTYQVNPAYPEGPKREKITGMVVIEALIDEAGKVVELKVLSSPDPRLSEAAMASLKQWKFNPATRPDGMPVAVRSTFSFNFQLY